MRSTRIIPAVFRSFCSSSEYAKYSDGSEGFPCTEYFILESDGVGVGQNSRVGQRITAGGFWPHLVQFC